ncbi:MAG: hypothetical protein RLZZ135_1280 [Cyanobacteriota bacterium]
MGIFSPIDVFVVTNMKNNFVATFMLLAAGLVILGGCKGEKIEQANSEDMKQAEAAIADACAAKKIVEAQREVLFGSPSEKSPVQREDEDCITKLPTAK